MGAAHHRNVRRMTMPGTGTILPFLTVELKSDGMGGSINHARNQAAASGACAVESVRRLYMQAGRLAPQVADTIAFSFCSNGIIAELWVHWYSAEKGFWYMSRRKTFVTAETEDVQACNQSIKNIYDWGQTIRKNNLKKVLGDCHQTFNQLEDIDTQSDVTTQSITNETGLEETVVKANASLLERSDNLSQARSRSSFSNQKTTTSRQSSASRRSSQTKNSSNTRRTSLTQLSTKEGKIRKKQ